MSLFRLKFDVIFNILRVPMSGIPKVCVNTGTAKQLRSICLLYAEGLYFQILHTLLKHSYEDIFY